MKIIETVDDTAFIQYRHPHLQPLEKPLYATIDWLELAKHKDDLLRIIGGEIPHESTLERLQGLVALLDAIQDDAEAEGYPVVWAYPANEVPDLAYEENND